MASHIVPVTAALHAARAYALLALLMMSQSSIYKKPRPQWMDMQAIAMPIRATSECNTSRKSGQIWLLDYRE